jgi:hypothetical protein
LHNSVQTVYDLDEKHGLGELSRRLDDARTDGIAEVGLTRSFKSGTHRIEVKEVTVHYLDPFS